jgi:hypothetical protein
LEKSRATIKPEEKATIMTLIKELSASIDRFLSTLYIFEANFFCLSFLGALGMIGTVGTGNTYL